MSVWQAIWETPILLRNRELLERSALAAVRQETHNREEGHAAVRWTLCVAFGDRPCPEA